ncbi:hypothetical protein D5018_13580 [Parashewanella curva]|uniref:Lipoprotein n=1 Tax=Parashewanella curva TaxID=2338552 RepID=A0A3L8PUS2_9GAMM|nr:hypothetical protein [Parashewanella curva]RLV59167.1 hypothetical protein D5018_13580 [Parashewanella curva]
MKRRKVALFLVFSFLGTSCSSITSNAPYGEKEVIQKVLDENKGNILSPNTIQQRTDSLFVNTGWGMKSETFYPTESSTYDFEYYFIKSKGSDGYQIDHFNDKKQQTFAKFKLSDRGLELRNSLFGDYSFASQFAECQFVLGKCEYRAFGYKVSSLTAVETDFVNGVWIRKVDGNFGARLIKEIYDKNGFLLLRTTKSTLFGKNSYSRKVRIPLLDTQSLYSQPPHYLKYMIKVAEKEVTEKCETKFSDRMFQELNHYKWSADSKQASFAWGKLLYLLTGAYDANDCLKQSLKLLIKAKSLIEESEVNYPYMENIDFLIEVHTSDLNL